MSIFDLYWNEKQKRDAEQKAAEAPPSQGGFLYRGMGLRDAVAFFGRSPDETALDLILQYGKSIWVYIAVSTVATAASQIGIKLMRPVKQQSMNGNGTDPTGHRGVGGGSDKAKLEQLFEDPLLDLLQKPNPWMTGSDLMYATFVYLELRGNCYFLMVSGNDRPISRTNPPKQLYLLNPDRVTIIPHPQQYVQGYVYEVDGRFVRYNASDVIHVKYFNPKNDYYGQSPMEALQDSLLNETSAVKYNQQFYKNNSVPEGVLKVDKTLTDEAYNRLRRKWDTAFKGEAHKTAILEEGMDYHVLTLSQRDAEFIASRNINRTEILACFGVPPVLAGLDVASFSTAFVQERVFWTTKIQPRVKKLFNIFGMYLVPLFDDKKTLEPDYTDIPALQMEENVKISKATVGFQAGLLTQNESRALLGYDGLGPEGDKIYLPMSAVPTDQATLNALLAADGDGGKKKPNRPQGGKPIGESSDEEQQELQAEADVRMLGVGVMDEGVRVL